MQQRRLRLGDILDDYCPRERRITNHVVVAMIEDDIRQTRCTTCDAEHEYKEAKGPALRRKKTGALSKEALEDARPRSVATPAPATEDESPLNATDDIDIQPAPRPAAPGGGAAVTAAPELPADTAGADDEELDERSDDDGPVHRRLIRATLPRPEGQAPEWKEPDFTMRQPGREANGNRPGQRSRGPRPARQAQGQPSGHNRFGGHRPAGAPRHGSGTAQGQGQPGQRQGNRPGQPPSHRSGGGGAGRPGGQNRNPGRKRGR